MSYQNILNGIIFHFQLQYLDIESPNPDGTVDRRTTIRQPQQMCLGPNFTLHRNSAIQAGVAQIFDRILVEMSVKMKRLNLDRAELTCLRGIILFNPGLRYRLTCKCNLINSDNFRYSWTEMSTRSWYLQRKGEHSYVTVIVQHQFNLRKFVWNCRRRVHIIFKNSARADLCNESLNDLNIS